MKAIAFDFDGTLIDSMMMWRTISKDLLHAYGREMTEELAQKLSTMSMTMNARFLHEDLGMGQSPQALLDEMGDHIHQSYTEKLKLFPDTRKVLETLVEHKVPLALATATNEEFIGPALEAHRLQSYFSFVQTCDNSGRKKNDPGFYRLLAEKFSLPPDQVILVDDAAYALTAAKQAGLLPVAVYDKVSEESWTQGAYKEFLQIPYLHGILPLYPYL